MDTLDTHHSIFGFHGSLEECIRFVYSVDFLVQVVSETRYDSIRDFFTHDKLEKTLSLMDQKKQSVQNKKKQIDSD